jgi:hypothetical protein
LDATEKFALDIPRIIAERKRHRRAVLTGLRDTVAASDMNGFRRALIEVMTYEWTDPAFRSLRGLNPSTDFKLAFLQWFIEQGDQLRATSRDGLALLDGLWVLLPRLGARSMVVFRGEHWGNRVRRTYGASWTRDEAIADSFARGDTRTHVGGSAVLRTVAPASAIIIAIPRSLDDFEEREVIIDRRRLGRVDVVTRYAQVSQEELEKQLGGPEAAD